MALSCTIIFTEVAYGAVGQILNDSFFQNPAELNTVHQLQLVGGNLFIVPNFHFTGTSYGAQGQATSKVNDSLPYLLTAYRFTDKLVLGLNINPDDYGHLNWPIGSIVENASTTTNVLYYRAGLQSSYQFTDKIAIGIGLNIENNKSLEINYVVPGLGNQMNNVSQINFTADFGIYYTINSKNFITMAVYSPVNKFGYGTSTLNTTENNNLSMLITDATVAYIGLEQLINDQWFMEEKIYWSNWSIQKNVYFLNTTTGSFVTPANWRDVLSFQIFSRYAVIEKLALLAAIIYETNPVPTINNQIGYPLSGSGSISLGLDINVSHEFSTQLIYGYGGFIPKAQINNLNSFGQISATFQAFVLQATYKS